MNRSLLVRLLLLLVPVLASGLFLRVYYTPDEPREASLVVAMAAQQNHAMPELGGVTFAEKPPLLYWLGGAVVASVGPSPAASRVPNLLYGLVTAIALALIARRAAGVTAAVVTGVVAVTALQLYDVLIWLATDAPLVAGVALSLAGMYAALTTESSSGRRRGYLMLAAGLGVAFFAKGPAAWMVPGFAYLTVIVLERRWRELLRPQLWLVVPVLALLIGAWVLAVLGRPDGLESLRVLFWYNLVGRAVAVDAPAQFAYASGHLNSPGKYLLELPLYLLPWTALAIAALMRSVKHLREPGATGTAWRLAVGAIVPSTVLLSCAATARGVYYAPPMLGFALMTGLEFGQAARLGEAAGGLAFALTRILTALLALVVGGLAVLLSFAPAVRDTGHVLLGLTALLACLYAVHRALRARGTRERALRDLMLSVCVTLVFAATPLWLNLNPLVSLERSAGEIKRAAAGHPLVLLSPDETTIAMAELYLGHLPVVTTLSSAAVGPGDPEVRYLWLVPDRYRWKASQWLAALGYSSRAGSMTSPPILLPPELSASVAETVIERPGGRRYALLVRAPATVRSP